MNKKNFAHYGVAVATIAALSLPLTPLAMAQETPDPADPPVSSEEPSTSVTQGWTDEMRAGVTITLTPTLAEGDSIVAVTADNGFTAVLEDDGTITVTSPENAAVGDTADITVTYATGEGDEATEPLTETHTITVVEDMDVLFADVSYASKRVIAGNSVVLPLKTGNKALPNGTTFSIDVDAEIAKVSSLGTVTIYGNAEAGTAIAVPVHVTFPDGTSMTVTAEATVVALQADTYSPTYGTPTIRAGVVNPYYPVTFGGNGIPGDITVPDRFLDAEAEVDGYEVTFKVDARSGDLADMWVPEDTPAGTVVRIPMGVQYGDGSVDEFMFEAEVVSSYAGALEPRYGDTGAIAGVEKYIDQIGVAELPDGTTFSLVTAEEGWGGSIDGNTGRLTFTAPENAEAGDKAAFVVRVVYPDGSSDTVNVSVTVQDSVADATTPDYLDSLVAPGGTVIIANTGEAFPEGTVVTPVEESISEGWNVDVDDEHALHVTSPEDAQIDDQLTFKVRIDYADGSDDGQEITVTVSLYEPDMVQRVIRRTIVIEVPPTQEEIDQAVRERDEKLAGEGGGVIGGGDAAGGSGALANTGADVGTVGLMAMVLAALGGMLAFFRRKRS